MRPGIIIVSVLLFLGQLRAGAAPVEFMGLEIDAKSIAFVCDGSRWQKNKADELIHELVKAIEAMEPDQQFAVIFFADDEVRGPGEGKLLIANDENKRKAKHWLDNLELRHDSTPIAGLTRAFQAKPDTIVFVSSGEFEHYDDVEAHINGLNKEQRVAVQTIGYFRNEKEDDSRSFIRLMQKIAERNRGKFLTAYADELKRRRS